MINANRKRSVIYLSIVVIAISLPTLASYPLRAARQSPPQIQITSPVAGTVVSPNQTVSVSVSSPTGTSFSKVAVIAEDPLISSSIAVSLPAQLTITVPATISPGTYMLTAMGTTTAGNVTQSTTVLIDVERPDMPTSISVNPSKLLFRSSGQRAPLGVSATFPDGSTLEVTRSSNLGYISSNTSVAAVDKNGIVKAVAKGSASITATYSRGTQNVSTTLQVTVPPPVGTSSPARLNFKGLEQ
jgi:hypothetical protein